MKKLSIGLRTSAIVAVVAVAVIVAMGAGGVTFARQYFVQSPSATDIFFMPGGNAKFDSDIARLDTRTGAVYRFRGDVDNASVRSTWELRVEPVKGETSGILEIQQIVLPVQDKVFPSPHRLQSDVEPTTFLVDVANGRTWILRHRASTNATWDPVDIHGSARFH